MGGTFLLLLQQGLSSQNIPEGFEFFAKIITSIVSYGWCEMSFFLSNTIF